MSRTLSSSYFSALDNGLKLKILYCLPALAVFVFVYFQTFSWIFQTWSTYRGSHGPIILSIGLYIIWTKRGVLKATMAEPNLLFGTLLTALGCLMLVSGRFGSILLLQYVSLIVSLWGLVLLFWGVGWLKVIWYPIGYLVFMFPIFSELLSGFSIYLQNAAAWIAYNILAFSGVAVMRYAQFIELPNVTLEVAKACNGINHIVALVSLAIPLAYWTIASTGRRLILIISAFFIGVFANGIRVAIIGFLAVYKKGGPLHGPYDIFYASFIFFFGMALLFAVSALLKEKGTDLKQPQVANSGGWMGHEPSNILSTTITATVILALTAGYLVLLKPVPVQLSQPLRNFPLSIGGWTGHDTSFSEPPFMYFKADEELKRVYRDEHGREIRLYIGYFPSQKQDSEVVNYRFDPLQQDSGRMRIALESDSVEIKSTKVGARKNGGRTYFWYDINGRVFSDRYSAKFATIMDALLRRRTNAAIVVVDTGMRRDEGDAKNGYGIDFIKESFPLIQSFLLSRTT